MSWGLPDAVTLAERLPLPDAILSAGISRRVSVGLRAFRQVGLDVERNFARAMRDWPVADRADAANQQHYELPSAFFGLVLGPHRKYSCCCYDSAADTLAEAEARALGETVAHADLQDGQTILELGCGWGSLTLWMARRLPRSRIVAVSNSASQRQYIESELARCGLTNVTVVTRDMNEFAAGDRFDRIVSVEMFEHMSNWPVLLQRVRGWLAPGGRLFLHVFSHHSVPYRFDAESGDWIARYFFTGGLMPSHGLIRQFDGLFRVEEEWQWSGLNYRRTALDWLGNFDRNRAAIRPILRAVYGRDSMVWERRWRLFFLATAGLWGHSNGTEWGVSHYRLAPTP